MPLTRWCLILLLATMVTACVGAGQGEKPGAAAEAWKDTPTRPTGDPFRGRWW